MKKRINQKFIIYLIVMVLYSISLVLFTSSMLKLKGIETLIRYSVLAIFYLLGLMYLLGGIILVGNRKKKKLFISISIGLAIIIPILITGFYYINKTFNAIGTINKNKITYTSVLVTNKDTNTIIKLGMIANKNDVEGYKLAKKLISKYQLDDLEIIYYEEYTELLAALYSNNVDGIFLSENYSILFESEYPNIISETKIKYKYSEELEKNESTLTSSKNLDQPFTILLIGVDGVGDTLNANQSFNGDTLMLITFNPNTLNATMFSIPRDTYVEIACRNNAKAKINTSAYYGTSCVIDTIENLTDIKIDYYVKINFKGVINLVDALGGINVDVPYAFCEQNSKRQWGKNTVYVEEGLQHLNGEQALALSRNRHYWPAYCSSKYNTGTRNDFVRGQNQQLVVTSIAKSVKSINSLNDFDKILKAISSNIDTNLTTNKLLSFYEVAKDMLIKLATTNNDFINIEKTYLTTYNQNINSRSMEIYYPSSLREIVNSMKINLELEKPKMITTFDFSINENYEKHVIGKTTQGGVILENTMPDFIGKTQSEINDWAKSTNITVNYISVTKQDLLYKDTLVNGYVVSQYPKKSSKLENIKKIDIYIIKKLDTIEIEKNNDIDEPIQDLLE